MEMARFAEPIDKFVMADWQGAEIYEGETYLEMHNGDVVINEIVNIVELAGEQLDKLSNVSDRLEDARQILISLNVGDEIGEVMGEIKEVIKIIEDAQADIY